MAHQAELKYPLSTAPSDLYVHTYSASVPACCCVATGDAYFTWYFCNRIIKETANLNS